ncbi:MAG: amidohydrolase family protein [Desulfobacterales bacterium]|jgi:predicted TIM-barrel fold metal-dependent hydrolase
MIIDAHVHCGIQDKFPPQSYDDYFSVIRGSGIQEAVMFPPVMEIYDRYDPNFTDSAQWKNRRKSANEYLLHIGTTDLTVIPYFFIWNDFAVDQLTSQHKGIKWHRHPDEPVYHYDSPLCQRAVDEIRSRNMPVVLEEEFDNTVRFIEQIAKDVTVIIPHMGMLNGGYGVIKRHGLWARPNVYADTALASVSEITDYINEYGIDRIIFGSDFPFGDPQRELLKIMHLQISQEQKEIICGLNIQRLLAESNV